MEKRVMPRFNLSLRAILSFADGPSRELLTRDISSGGAFFETGATMPEGTRVFLSIFPQHHPDSRQDLKTVESIKGEVKRRSSQGMAIAFEGRLHF